MKQFNSIVALITFTLLFISKSAISANFPPLTKYHEPIVCSNEWANLAQTCPSNVKAFITNRNNYPKYTSCPASSPTCNEEWGMMQTVEHIYLFVNADTGQASRWVMALTPEVKRPDGQIIQAGKKVVSQQASTNNDIKIGQLLNEIKGYHDEFAKLGNITFTGSGVIDGYGNYQEFSSYHDTCQTAADFYFTEVSKCDEDLTSAVNLAIQDAVFYHSFVSAISQLGQVLQVSTPWGSIDLSKLETHRWVLSYPDGSKLVLNITVSQGLIKVAMDLEFSLRAGGTMFSSLIGKTYMSTESIQEAEAFARSNAARLDCTTRTLPFGTEVKVKAVKVVGNKVTFIYEVNDIEQSITYCD